MVNCANNIMHQKVTGGWAGLTFRSWSRKASWPRRRRAAPSRRSGYPTRHVLTHRLYKEKISTLECENQLLEAELDKFRLQVVQMQAELTRLKPDGLPEANAS